MIIRVPYIIAGKNFKVEYNNVTIDDDFKFRKELSKTFVNSFAKFIGMSGILPNFINFGGIIFLPPKGLPTTEYRISAFANDTWLFDGIKQKEKNKIFSEYKNIAMKREEHPNEFNKATTYKLSNELMKIGGGFFYKSILISNEYEGDDYKIINEHIILGQESNIEGINPGKDLQSWQQRFKNVNYFLNAMIGMPIYVKTGDVLPLCFVCFFTDSKDFFPDPNDASKNISKKHAIVNWLDDMANLFNNIIFSPVVSYILSKYQNSFVYSSIVSAIAAIMSRNGSHNIGSHVLSAVSNSYNDLPDDQVLFEYIQQRMDFVATISTEFPQWTYPVWFIGDLMRRFYMQRHLLNYIGQSEGLFAYEFRTKLENINNMPSNRQTNKIFIKIKRKGSNKFIIPSENRNGNEFKDFQVAIPGGIIGQHAFYTILENIIRNSAKHNWASLNDSEREDRRNLEITIEIDENKKREDIVFRIWDNASNVFKDFSLDQKINKKLRKSFVDRDIGKLIKANWGLAEMKISAGFLNMKSVAQIGSDDVDEILYNAKKSTGIIRAIRKRERREGEKDIWHLGYEFAIKKPKEFLIIDYIVPGDIESYLENGINFVREKDLKSHDYEFVIIYDDINNENDFVVELIKNIDNLNGEIEKYPFRLFLVTSRADIFEKSQFLQKRICFLEPKIFIEKIKEPKQFKIWAYKKWVKHLKTITGNANKSINMLINIFGERSHGQVASLVKLLFENYKERIVGKSLGH